MKNNKYILLLIAVAAVLLLVKKKQDNTPLQTVNKGDYTPQQTVNKGDWAVLVDSIGNTLEKGANAAGRLVQTVNEEKRKYKREDYMRLRDTKDNSALFSNDMLIY